jgi:uncharacterized protein
LGDSFARVAGPLERALGVMIRFGKQLSPIRRATLIGLASSLMPCGWLYVFALAAAGTASPLWGGLVMTVFWAGTVPIMVALGLGWGRLSSTFQAKVPVTMAILVILIGFFTLVYRSPVELGTMVAGDSLPTVLEHPAPANAAFGSSAALKIPQTTAEAIEQIQSLDHNQLPCCQAPTAGAPEASHGAVVPTKQPATTERVTGTGP